MNDAGNIRRRGAVWPWLAPAVALAIVAVGSAGFYSARSRNIEAQQQAHGALLLDMAENGLRAHLRAGQYHPEHIEDWFLGLMVSARLGGIRLDGERQQEILALGMYAQPGQAPEPVGYVEVQRTLQVLESLPPPRGWRRGGMRGAGPDMGVGPGRGMGPGLGQGMGPGAGRGMGPGMGPDMGWLPLPPGPYTFSLALDAALWRERRTALRAQTFIGAALASGCVLLLAVLLLLRDRQLRLRLQLNAAEEQAARQAVFAQLGAGLAHETKNPLGLIRGLAQRVRDHEDIDNAIKKRLSDIIDETDRVVGRIDSFLSFAKPIAPERKRVALISLFTELEALLRDEANAANIIFTLDSGNLNVDADPDLLRRALLNLLLNAFKACKHGGEVTVTAKQVVGQSVAIAVRDTGVGIVPDDLPRITTPYFSRFEEGVGLGLALTDEFVRAHGWRLLFTSAPGKGTEAIITGIKPMEPQP